MKNIFFVFIFAIFLTSCTEVIDIDLNSSNPALVIEGSITNEVGPYSIKLSKSVNYDDSNTFPSVSGATVIISDDAGNRDTLTEGTGGIYTTKRIQGTEGRTYNLFIKDGEKEYTSISKMENMITLDSIYSFVFSGGGPGGPGRDSNMIIFNVFKDPGAVKNYYRLVQYIKKPTESIFTKHKGIVVTDDLNTNGNLILIPYFGGSDVMKNDSVIMELQTLNKAAYDYLNTLDEISGGGGFGGSGTPANPTSNISGGAMGYFSAHTVSRQKIKAE